MGLQGIRPAWDPKFAARLFQPCGVSPSAVSLILPTSQLCRWWSSEAPPPPPFTPLRPSLSPGAHLRPPSGRQLSGSASPRGFSSPPILFPLATWLRAISLGPRRWHSRTGVSWCNPGMAWERSRSKTRSPCGGGWSQALSENTKLPVVELLLEDRMKANSC